MDFDWYNFACAYTRFSDHHHVATIAFGHCVHLQ